MYYKKQLNQMMQHIIDESYTNDDTMSITNDDDNDDMDNPYNVGSGSDATDDELDEEDDDMDEEQDELSS